MMNKKFIIIAMLSIVTTYRLVAQVSGNVFMDTNADGIFSKKSKTEKGISGVTVTVKNNNDDIIAKTITDSKGDYFLDIPPNQKVKVIFEELSNKLYATQKGIIRFVDVPAKNISLGLYNPTKYLAEIPKVVLPIFVNGYPIGRTTQHDIPAIIASEYHIEKDTFLIDTLAYSSTIGAVWGIAYSPFNNKIYSSAFLKRHAGFGELGISGIYQIDVETKEVEPFLKLEDLGINCGNVERKDLKIELGSKSIEKNIFPLIGKIGLGGLDVSDDGSMLYLMNLYDKKLYAIPLNFSKGNKPVFKTHTFPFMKTKEGEMRPFAVKYFEGKIYMGVVNDASISQNIKDLKGYVYVLDPITEKVAEILNIPLNYPRGKAVNGSEIKGWYPWTDDFSKAILSENPSTAIYPQPILSDIEFDEEGSMILGFMDRFGHQTGDGQPDPNGKDLYTGIAAGDILKVFRKRESKYTLEANAAVGKITTEGINNTQGPKGGEFYHQEYFAPKGREIIHEENGTGGLAYLRNSDEVLNSVHEPNNEYNTGGIKWLDNQKGTSNRGVSVFYDNQEGTFSKSNNVGDLELITGSPTIEIGNRVWMDCNEDGIQNADEKPLNGINIELFEGGKFIGGTSTDDNGEYYFNNKNCLEIIKPNTEYSLKIRLKQAKYAELRLTKSNNTQGELDNDAILEDDSAIIKFKTTIIGERLYKYDFGFACIEKINSELQITCGRIDGETEATVSLKSKALNNEHFNLMKSTTTSFIDYEKSNPIPQNRIILIEKIKPNQVLDYSLRIINQADCFKDYTFSLSEKGCLALNDNPDLQENLTISPNPVIDNKLKFSYKSLYESNEITVSVFDVLGKEILQKNLTVKNGFFTDIVDLEYSVIGSYLLRIQDNAKVISKHFIKQ